MKFTAPNNVPVVCVANKRWYVVAYGIWRTVQDPVYRHRARVVFRTDNLEAARKKPVPGRTRSNLKTAVFDSVRKEWLP